ncbi:MAG: response regulator [Desulfobacca sp.]|uniref:response regulator n=1 Tax=Desulfobacca sp. TaxID=2067990 RepID=UPI004049A607
MASGRVLIIDDDQRTREAMGEILTRAGYQVTVLASGDGLEALLDCQSFVAAIIDFNLPERNGLEIAHSVRRRLPACRIILISSEYRPERHGAPGSEVVDCFLAKPFSRRLLLNALTSPCPVEDGR